MCAGFIHARDAIKQLTEAAKHNQAIFGSRAHTRSLRVFLLTRRLEPPQHAQAKARLCEFSFRVSRTRSPAYTPDACSRRLRKLISVFLDFSAKADAKSQTRRELWLFWIFFSFSSVFCFRSLDEERRTRRSEKDFKILFPHFVAFGVRLKIFLCGFFALERYTKRKANSVIRLSQAGIQVFRLPKWPPFA